MDKPWWLGMNRAKLRANARWETVAQKDRSPLTQSLYDIGELIAKAFLLIPSLLVLYGIIWVILLVF